MKTAEAKTSPSLIQRKAVTPFFNKGSHKFLGNDVAIESSSFFGGAQVSTPILNGKPIQAKLTIGQPNDKYEIEADAMADQVVQRLAKPEKVGESGKGLQFKKMDTPGISMIQSSCSDCEKEEKLQKKENDKENRLTRIQKKAIFESDSETNIQKNPDSTVSKKENTQNRITTAIPVIQSLSSAKSSSLTVQSKSSACEQEENLQLMEEEVNGGKSEKLFRKPIFESNEKPTDIDEDIQRKCSDCESNNELISPKVLAQAMPSDCRSIVQRSCRECEEGNKVLMKPIDNIQRSLYDQSADADGSRTSIVAAAQSELGKVEARLNDGTGSRVGADRLLEYFNIAAPGVWDDSIIETAGAEMPSWCGIFSVWAHKKAGKDVGEWQMGKGVSAFNTLTQTDNPQPGDIGYIHEPNQHHALVKEVQGEEILTIDGNSGINSEVKENTKAKSEYTGFLTAFGGSGDNLAKVQTKSDIRQASTDSSSIESRLSSSAGKGNTLPVETRDGFEQSFGADFSNIRIHTDTTAQQLSKDLNAQAFTHGRDIYFNAGKYDTDSNAGKHLLAHELTHTLQQGSAINKVQLNGNPSATGLPTVDPATIPASWRVASLEASGGVDVYVYRGVANNATERLSSGVLTEDTIGGVLSRRTDAAHDAIFNLVGRDPVLTGPSSGGVIRIRIPASVWDELVRTNSISERSYPGFSRQIVSTEIRVNSNEAVRLLNSLARDIISPDPYYDFRPGAIRPATPNPVEAVPVTAAPQNFQVEANYEVLNTSRVPGSNNMVAEVEVLLANGLDDLNRSTTLNGAEPVPNRMIIRITISPEGALVAAESAAGESNALVQFLARGAVESIPRTPSVSPWVRGVGWVGLALFVGITWYRYHNASEADRPRILARAGGGFAAGMVGGYIVCNLVLGIETLGWSLVICGFLVGIPAGMAGEAIADVAYDEATVDDDEIRDYTNNSSLEQIRALPFAEKVRMIFSLMKGWVSEEDIVAIERICLSINNITELNSIGRIVEPQLLNLTSIGQRTRVRVALARRIQPKLINQQSGDQYEQEAESMAEKSMKNLSSKKTANNELNAHTFTHGNDIYFYERKYNPSSDQGTNLPTHELFHVVHQQSPSNIQRTPDVDSSGSCPNYETDEVVKSRTVAGWLPQDLVQQSPSELLFADFGNNQSNVRRSSQTEPLWISWKDTFSTDGSYRISIVGYSDCSGNEEINISIRQARALAIERALGSGINNKLSFRGMAGLGQMVTSNDTPENRAKNRGVIIEYKQGFFFDSEAFENAQRANGLIQTALTELSASSEARERNVPAYITQRGISIGPLTPRHDTTTTTPAINFFAGTSDYANSFALPSATRFHIYNSNAGIGIQVRIMPDLIGTIPLADVKERIVQAVSQIAHLTAVGTAAAGTTIEQYKAQFNAWWNVAPYNTINTEFNPALDSFGPRTNRAREIFKKIYNENTSVKNDYDNNTGAIKEKIDTYNIPEGFNLINSPRLQTLREVFTANVPPISNANYPAFKTAIETSAANLDSDDRISVSSSNDWQRLINLYITDESKRQEIRSAINTPPSVPAPPAPAPTPGPSAGGGTAARTFLNNISIDGPTAPITANNSVESVTLTPKSTRPNPALNFSTKFTVTPAPRVIGNNISPESAWPSGVNDGVAFDPQISNNGNVTMNAHLDLINMPSGITPPAVSDLSFVVNDNRNANFLATWTPYFQYSLPGGDTDWYNVGDSVRYVGGSQQFRVSAWLPNGSVNPGLTLSVISRLKKGGVVVQNNASSPQSFPNNAQSSIPIPFNISAPASVPPAGESFQVEVDIIDSAAAVLGTKIISFTVMPEIVYTQAAAIAEATVDNNFFHDSTATGLLGIMTAMGGIASRVATAVNTPVANGGIVLLPMTARHDSAAYVQTTLGSPDPSKTGYFAGIDYSHSNVDVAGAAGFRTHSFPDLGDKVIILNRTTDIPSKSRRSNDSIITLLIHEAVHAMDVRPDSGTEIERYKTEFRAYWMDGRYGPPDTPVCPVASTGCYDATFNPGLRPPGPKSSRARVIFNSLYNNPITYPWVKQAYDNNPDFREQVDNYIYPDGINLMVSIRLESLRALIEAFTGAGFAALRTQVRQYMGLDVPAPASGVLDSDEKTYIRNSRAWRDLVERKITIPADRLTLKGDLGIPTTVGP